MSITKIANPISVEQTRIDKWQEKIALEYPNFFYEQVTKTDETNGNKTVQLKTNLDKKDISPSRRFELQSSTTCAISGSANPDYGSLLFEQTMKGFFSREDYASTANAINGALLAMAPADIIEGQLCARLLVLNNQIAEYMSRAASPSQISTGIDLNINRATKLMRVYNETLETLNKYRRKGMQTVVVQHVNVGNGGQAIVAGQLNPHGVSGKKVKE
jgi:hypothetical protein